MIVGIFKLKIIRMQKFNCCGWGLLVLSLLLGIFLVVAGCVSQRPTIRETGPKFVSVSDPQKGKALIYVYHFGTLRHQPQEVVTLGLKELGRLALDSNSSWGNYSGESFCEYLKADVAPGAYEIQTEHERPVGNLSPIKKAIEFLEGRTYFIRVYTTIYDYFLSKKRVREIDMVTTEVAGNEIIHCNQTLD